MFFFKGNYEQIAVVCIIFIISLVLVADLLLSPGEPATFDGRIHITNIAQHYSALKDGDIWVTWANDNSNYGMPMPLIAQHVTAYSGVALYSITRNFLFSYKLL